MPTTIGGPWRSWHQRRRLLKQKSTFTDCDIVWWTQSDPAGINEGQSEWWYTPKGDLDPDLVVQYHTPTNKPQHGQFIFPASFLPTGQYQIHCRIVNNSGEVHEESWNVEIAQGFFIRVGGETNA